MVGEADGLVHAISHMTGGEGQALALNPYRHLGQELFPGEGVACEGQTDRQSDA